MRLTLFRSKVLGIAVGTVFAVSAVSAQCVNSDLASTAWGGASGSLSVNGGTVTVSGTGLYSLYQSYEKGYAAYKAQTGNSQIQAEVLSLSGYVGSNTVAGIFIRENSGAGADGGLLWLQGIGGAQYKYAERKYDSNLQELGSGSASIPYWIRLQNEGGTIYPSISPDGSNWTSLASEDLSRDIGGSHDLDYGLMVWSGSSSQPATAVFGHVCVGPIVPDFTPTPSPGSKVWPNPFIPGDPPNDITHFILPAGHGSGELKIVNLKRKLVRSLSFNAGADVQWDGKADDGQVVPSGVYVYLLESDKGVSRGTVTVMK